MDKIDLDAIIKEFRPNSIYVGDYTAFFARVDVTKLMTEAIHEALVLASEKAITERYPIDPKKNSSSSYNNMDIRVDKQSILDIEKLIV